MLMVMPKFAPVPPDYAGMGYFSQLLKACKTPPTFMLTEDWLVDLEPGLSIIVPCGFITDFASVPRLFWNIPGFSPYGPLLYGAILHDFGYQHGYLLAPEVPDTEHTDSTIEALSLFPETFSTYTPVFIGCPQFFFDRLLRKVVNRITNAKFVSCVAENVLKWTGHHAWDRYRKYGPAAYGGNSLNLPGVDKYGKINPKLVKRHD